MKKEKKIIEYYMKRMSIGNYVSCEVCGCVHDDGGMMTYKGKEVYACFDCLEADEKELSERAKMKERR